MPDATTTPLPPVAETLEEKAFSLTNWHKLREPLKPLGRQVCIAIALRAAKRVDVLVSLRDVALEAVAAGFDVPHRVWDGRTAGAAWSSAAEAVLAATGGRAASTAVSACIDAANAADDAPANLHRLVAQDIHLVQQITDTAKSGGIPLTGWDDPRLGPLWPDGPPKWHKKAEQLLRELKDKLANRPDPFARPVSEEKLSQVKDANFLCVLHRRGELDQFGGCHVVAYREQIVGHGSDLAVLRAEVAARLGVPETRLAITFVPAF